MSLDIDAIMVDLAEASRKEQAEFHRRYSSWRKFIKASQNIMREMLREKENESN